MHAVFAYVRAAALDNDVYFAHTTQLSNLTHPAVQRGLLGNEGYLPDNMHGPE